MVIAFYRQMITRRWTDGDDTAETGCDFAGCRYNAGLLHAGVV